LGVCGKTSIAIYGALEKIGIDFFVTFPCNWTSRLLDLIAHDRGIIHVPVTREEEGIGVAAGAWLGGKKPAIIMQSSGVGNSLNALLSLNRTYNIPLLILISHRGIEREKIVAQKGMGTALKNLLKGAGIHYYELSDPKQIDPTLVGASDRALIEKQPVAVILSPDLLLEKIDEG
jgi:sulfopyruvate decarboxylase subunit alpha